jgi:hypothetical protein
MKYSKFDARFFANAINGGNKFVRAKAIEDNFDGAASESGVCKIFEQRLSQCIERKDIALKRDAFLRFGDVSAKRMKEIIPSVKYVTIGPKFHNAALFNKILKKSTAKHWGGQTYSHDEEHSKSNC